VTQKKSDPQTVYLTNLKKRHLQNTILRRVIFVLFLCLWEICADKAIIDAFFFSSPSRIMNLFFRMCADHSIFQHTWTTLCETLISFLLVNVLSVFCATLLWYSKRLSEILEAYLVILNSLPKSALAPLFIVWLGTGMDTIIVAGISVALFGSIISFYTAFEQCDREKIMMIKTLGGNRHDCFFKVVLPGAIPILLSTSKVNIGLSLVGVIIGEFLSARRGLGYLIIYGSQIFQLDLVILSIFLLCIFSVAFYKGIQLIEKKSIGSLQ